MKSLLVLLIKALIFWAAVFALVGGGLYVYFWYGGSDETPSQLEQALLAVDAKDHAKAEMLAKKGIEATKGGSPAAQAEAVGYKRVLLDVYLRTGRANEAENTARDILASVEKTPGTSPSDVALAAGQLADILYQHGKKEESNKLLEQVVAEIESGKVTATDASAYGRYLMARSQAEKGDHTQAVKNLELALKEVDVLFPEHPEEVLAAEELLARSYLQQGQADRARAVLTRSVHQMENTEGIQDQTKAKIYASYADVMRAAGNKAEADLWSAKAANVTSK